MEQQVNEKLENYFFRNKVLVGYLKIMNTYYKAKKMVSISDKRYLYERILKDINFIMNKQVSEETRVKGIVLSINERVYNNQTAGLEEIYNDFIELINILNKSIDNSDRYIEGRFTKYKLMKKNIKFIPNVDYETIQEEKVANHFNQKMLKKEIKKEYNK